MQEHVPGAGVDERRVWVECDRDRVGAARWPDLHFFARQKALIQVGEHWSSGFGIDVRGSIHFDVGMRGNQLAVGSIQHVKEAVLVGLNHHFPWLTVHHQIRQHVFVGAVHVVHIVWCVLEVTCDLSRLWPERKHAGREQAVQRAAGLRIVRFSVARAPINEVQLRIVRAGSPGCCR